MHGEDIKLSFFSALTEFFSAIENEKAHWYRPFEDEACDMLIKSSFPSLANLMKVEERHVRRLLLYVGLAKEKEFRGRKIVYAVQQGWDNYISQHKLHLETTYFEINKKRLFYI